MRACMRVCVHVGVVEDVEEATGTCSGAGTARLLTKQWTQKAGCSESLEEGALATQKASRKLRSGGAGLDPGEDNVNIILELPLSSTFQAAVRNLPGWDRRVGVWRRWVEKWSFGGSHFLGFPRRKSVLKQQIAMESSVCLCIKICYTYVIMRVLMQWDLWPVSFLKAMLASASDVGPTGPLWDPPICSARWWQVAANGREDFCFSVSWAR